MELRFKDRGIVELDDVRLVYRNFAGKAGEYNDEGDRNFCVIIPNQDIADDLMAAGYNVKIKPPYEEGESPFMYLKVKVNFAGYNPPSVYVEAGNSRKEYREDEIHRLDKIDIASVDLDISPYDWSKGGRSGRTAYLRSMYIVQDSNRFADRMAGSEYPEE